jgi:hypothetical protein
VVGGDEVPADPQRVEQERTGLDVVAVGGDRGEQRAQVFHPAVVDALEPSRHPRVAPGPVAHGQVDLQRLAAAGAGQHRQAAQPGRSIAAVGLDALDDGIDAAALPGVQQLVQQGAPVGEVAVEAALGDAERAGQGLDAHGVRASGGEGVEALLDPAAAGRASDGHCQEYTQAYRLRRDMYATV